MGEGAGNSTQAQSTERTKYKIECLLRSHLSVHCTQGITHAQTNRRMLSIQAKII